MGMRLVQNQILVDWRQRAIQEIQQQEDQRIFDILDSIVGKQEKSKMYFGDLNHQQQITAIKREFSSLVKTIFDHPENLKRYILEKKLSNDQSRAIWNSVNKLNANKCPCCRRFSANSLSLSPVERDLEPLIDIAQALAKTRNY